MTIVHHRWSKNQERNRRIYERKMRTGASNEQLAAIFGLNRSVIGYNIRQYKKDLEAQNG